MNSAQTAAGAIGLGLAGVNFWTGPQHTVVVEGIFGSGHSAAEAHRQLKYIAAELLFVGVAVLVAGFSPQAGTAVVAILLALSVIWAINHYSKGTGS